MTFVPRRTMNNRVQQGNYIDCVYGSVALNFKLFYTNSIAM